LDGSYRDLFLIENPRCAANDVEEAHAEVDREGVGGAQQGVLPQEDLLLRLHAGLLERRQDGQRHVLVRQGAEAPCS
jgi:hypothetical protein